MNQQCASGQHDFEAYGDRCWICDTIAPPAEPCKHCGGSGVYRTLINHRGKVTETLADCEHCKKAKP